MEIEKTFICYIKEESKFVKVHKTINCMYFIEIEEQLKEISLAYFYSICKID